MACFAIKPTITYTECLVCIYQSKHASYQGAWLTDVDDSASNTRKMESLTRPAMNIIAWIKSISNELDITCDVFVSQLSGHRDVIANRLWRHQQNVKRASETRGLCVKILVLASFMDSLCRVRNKIMYVLLWRTVYGLTPVLFWCLFPSLLCNSGNKHEIKPSCECINIPELISFTSWFEFKSREKYTEKNL